MTGCFVTKEQLMYGSRVTTLHFSPDRPGQAGQNLGQLQQSRAGPGLASE